MEQFKWEKLGQVFDLSKLNTPNWMQVQAQNPYVIEMEDYIRVYFNCRSKKSKDGKNISYAGFVDLDKYDFSKVLNISLNPILQLGLKGDFDEFGVMSGSVIKVEKEHYLYYCGWTRMSSVPYNWAIGLAKSQDGGKKFSRFGKGPILGATHNEPYLQAGCSTIFKVGDLFHLWYTSGIKWVHSDEKPESVYQIMHATSKDGINWDRNGEPVIKSIIDNEAQASPSIIKIGLRWHMVFSYRYSVDFRNKERGYRLGHAWSDNLESWNRDDSIINFDISDKGWDSEMVCYPNICSIGNEIYLFYCGNNFGESGFGVAVLKP